jgi:hypothetical protein
MGRTVSFVIAVAVAAFAVWYVWRISQQTSSASVSALLPRETIFLAHVPDFNRTRDQWNHSDLCQLYREPAVQDFLRKPLAKLSKKDAASQTLQEIEQLDPKNAFFALTSMANDSPKIVVGFRFRENQNRAEKIIAGWCSEALGDPRDRETIAYQRHKIHIFTFGLFSLAIVYDRNWFFASNNLAEIKTLLDRADGRVESAKNTLDANESYHAAAAHMPSSYAASFYLQPKMISERLTALRAAIEPSGATNERPLLEQVRSISGAMRFESGKIHDLLFLGMPKLEQDAALTRSSLTLGTKETFFYLSMLLNVGQKIDALNQAAGIAGTMQKFFQTFSDSGITADDWKAAFGLELESLADWPSNAPWPSLILTLPVIDMARAGKIVEAVTRADENAIWTQTEKDSVRYFSMPSPATLIAITPTIALSHRILIAGFNPVSVEESIKRDGSGSSELSNSQTYKTAAKLVPSPTNFFAYIDAPILYSRLDASLRPMLLMAAVFMPGMTDCVDLTRLPAPEVITKHLSPIVSSQRYASDGYVAESVGPITLDQSAIGLAILTGIGAAARQKGRTSLTGWGSPSTGTPQPSLSPSSTPDPASTP